MFLITNNILASQVLIPFITAIITAILPSKLSKSLSILSLFLSLLNTLYIISRKYLGNYHFGGWTPPYGIEYKLYSIDYIFLLVINITGIFGVFYGFDNREISTLKENLYYSLYLFAITGMLGIVVTNDIFNIYVFLEVFSLSSYVLAAISKSRKSLISAFNYLIIGSISACIILIAIGLIYSKTGNLNISFLSAIVSKNLTSSTIRISLIFFIIGTIIKAGFFPVYNWIINLYNDSSTGVVFLISGLSSKISLYILIKIITRIYPPSVLEYYNLQIPLRGIFLITIFLCSAFACYSTNTKKILTLSSLVNTSYIGLIICDWSDQSNICLSLIVIGHGLSKPLLFLFSNLTQINIVSKLCLIINCANISSIPLTLGFLSKWHILVSLLSNKLYFSFIIVIFSSFLAFIYVLKFYNIISKNIIIKKSFHKGDFIFILMTSINIVFTLYSNLLLDYK